MSLFPAIVETLTATILAERFGEPAVERAPAVARFVREQHGRMAAYLRGPLWLATVGFNYSSVPFRWRTFLQSTAEARRGQLRGWRESRLGFRRDFARFYESLAIFGYASEIHDVG